MTDQEVKYPRLKCLKCPHLVEWDRLIGDEKDRACVLFTHDQFEDFNRPLLPNDPECPFGGH